MTAKMTPEEIFSELFYRARRDGLDPVLWRIHPKRLPMLLREFQLRGYGAIGVNSAGKREIFGLEVYLEEDRGRLPPAPVRQDYGSQHSREEPNYVCLECLEPARLRTVYREWVDGKFI